MTSKHQVKREKKKGKFGKRLMLSMVIMAQLGVISLAIGAVVFINGVSKAEIPESPTSIGSQSEITFFAKDGRTVLATLQPEEGGREPVSSEQISDNMKHAIVSAEDKTFYDNMGFNPLRIASAALGHARGTEGAGGGSGITQQFVKNNLVGDEYSLERKWEEILSSTKLTASWDKDDILTAYLNTVYFGRGANGIENAAQAYFGVNAGELTKSQSILLAGVVQSPSVHDPAVNLESAQKRFDYVKSQMVDNGYVTSEEKNSIQLPETIEPEPISQSIGLDTAKGHIVTMAMNELEEQGYDRDKLFDIGANITTTIDPRVQDSLENTSRDIAGTNDVRVSTVSTDPSTGGIAGIYGGDDGLGYNYATNPQMTGSTFKVFTLAAALQSGIGLDTSIDSSPYPVGNTVIQNSDGASCGSCSIAEATKQSLNTSYYRIQDMLPNQQDSTRDMARKLGVNAQLSEEDGSVNKGITLGLYGSTPQQMSSAFSTIANNGVRNDSHIVSNVKTRNGQLSYTTNTHPVRILSEGVSNDIDRALEPIADYSNNRQLSGKTGYMKTGTVQLGDAGGQNRDAWTVGYTDDLSTSVWVGTDDGQPLVDASGAAVWGAGLPAETWQRVMNEVG